METVDLLFRNGYVITLDDERRVYRRGYVAVTGDRISGVGQDSECPFTGKNTYDLDGRVILPGLVNAHNHLNQIAFRGNKDDRPRQGGMAGFIRDQIVLWSHADAETTATIVRLHLLDMLKGGTTATHEQHFTNVPGENIDGILSVLNESGMRAFVSRVVMNLPDTTPDFARETVEHVLNETRRLRRTYNSDRINVTASPINPSYVQSAEDLIQLRQGLREIGVPFDIDLVGDLWEQTKIYLNYPGTSVEYCDSLGILDDQTLGGKSFLMQGDDYAIFAKRGVRSCLVPYGRIYRESGSPLHHFLAEGILPGLGTDSTMSQPSTSLWETMRLVLIGMETRKALDKQKGDTKNHDVTASVETALEMATLGGKRALFLDEAVAGLAQGNAADLIVVNTNLPAFQPSADDTRLLTSLVWCAEASMVDTVVVAGKILIEDGISTVWDEEQVIADAEAAVSRLYEKAGFTSVRPDRGVGGRQGGWSFL